MAIWGWKVVGSGGSLPPGAVVRPEERLPWPKTIGIGAQHVVAMFGATFVFPLLMGLDANLAIMLSGVCTILFLLVVNGKIPSYLGSSASFVGVAAAITAGGGTTASITGAILVAGVVLALVGVLVHFAGGAVIRRVLPPVVSGAVVMLIGFNLAPVVGGTYWPQDPGVAIVTMLFTLIATVAFRGFFSRIAVFLALVFGYVLSWVLDRISGQIVFPDGAGNTEPHFRVNLDAVGDAAWFGLPDFHAPEFHLSFILLALPGVIALIAENTGHVRAVAEMTGDDLDPYMGRALLGDGLGTTLASAVGGAPTTTYAENIGVMAATRVYSTAAYWVAAVVAILLGLVPKFGAVVNATPGGVLGGITVVLYGMIGLLGAKIWIENRVDFGNPVNLVPIAAGVIIGIGDVQWRIGDDFVLGGIALGSIVAIVGWHLARVLAPREMRDGLVLDRDMAPRKRD
ncbi:uracil-xanthine permease family protein [Nakamurella leprariae]|uniref:Nitrate reductase n=1 Tax=Nakamurella leprariae TaxID=2803911 RepID=A0A938YJA9_9ACTN|nr:solute carrier family 23 protein [Nakamurella leprariae]MBM9468903.1 nitrate reductase [Nakamurella leprariae]